MYSLIKNHTSMKDPIELARVVDTADGSMQKRRRALVFRGPQRGQGIGTMMKGFATALHIGGRFGRHVCVSWAAFEAGFQLDTGPCPQKHELFSHSDHESAMTTFMNPHNIIELWSFGHRDTLDARAHGLLASNETIVVMHGDGGTEADAAVRMPFPVTPRPVLQPLLQPAFELVIHLRAGDPHEAAHRGLFSDGSATASLLASLPKAAYVLTDSDEVHGALCPSYTCPSWGVVPHSSYRELAPAGHADERQRHATRTLRTWADWWAIRTASHVLHTPSAFSESALTFSNATGCVLRDVQSLHRCVLALPPLRDTVRAGGSAEGEDAGRDELR